MPKTTRLAPAVYLYVTRGRRYVLKEVRVSDGFPGRPLWHVCAVPADAVNDWCHDPGFDAAGTLRDAKSVADDDAEYWTSKAEAVR